jgi:hypothetical protein
MVEWQSKMLGGALLIWSELLHLGDLGAMVLARLLNGLPIRPREHGRQRTERDRTSDDGNQSLHDELLMRDCEQALTSSAQCLGEP